MFSKNDLTGYLNDYKTQYAQAQDMMRQLDDNRAKLQVQMHQLEGAMIGLQQIIDAPPKDEARTAPADPNTSTELPASLPGVVQPAPVVSTQE